MPPPVGIGHASDQRVLHKVAEELDDSCSGSIAGSAWAYSRTRGDGVRRGGRCPPPIEGDRETICEGIGRIVAFLNQGYDEYTQWPGRRNVGAQIPPTPRGYGS